MFCWIVDCPMYEIDEKTGMVVKVRGKDVSPLMKTEVRRLAVANSDSFDLKDIFALQDKDKTDIGHKDVPKSKGGSNTIENLFVQDSSWNRSEQDNH